MMVIWRKRASHDSAGCGEVNGELARDGGVLDIRNAFGRKQARKDMAVLAGFACGERSERPNREAEVEANAVEVAGADAGTGEDKQTVLSQKCPQLVDEREDCLMAAIHDGAAADLHNLHPREEPDRASAGDWARKIVVEECLPGEGRGDVLDLVGISHGHVSLSLQ